MRIALDARYLKDDYSGIGVYSENLIEALASTDRTNEYLVITHSSFRRTLKLGDNFTVVSYSAPPVSIRSVSALHSFLRPYEVDLLHSLFPLSPLFWDRDLLVTVHDLQPLMDPDFTGRRPLAMRLIYDAFYRTTYPAVMRKADCLICDSYATLRWMRELCPDVAGKAIVVYGGIDPECAKEPSEDEIEHARSKYEIPDRFLFYIGSTRPNKNLSTMLDAFEEFIRRYPEHDDLCWVLVVKPDRFFDPFFAKVTERGLLKRVKIYSQVSEVERRVFYHLATLLYFVTKFEGFGLPVLEAQASKLPVLASTHGALPEVAGKGAILVDPDDRDSIVDGLSQFFSRPDLRDRLIEAGEENVQRFSWRRTAREIVQIYTHIFAQDQLDTTAEEE
ncbi:MAG: glycosyltransferase family 4 protein [Candidatus Sumerlaeaceae bacterium]|nr:glycosyltransferase family 4 protein [Candidatus Sumerlaeaceae bacterium]